MTSDPRQSRGYSARIGQEVEIHYRWHALYGRPVRRYYSEKRAEADVVVVEGEPGAAVVVAAWMLDRRLVQEWRSVRLTFPLRRLWIFIGY
jgi:hypothetical protein